MHIMKFAILYCTYIKKNYMKILHIIKLHRFLWGY